MIKSLLFVVEYNVFSTPGGYRDAGGKWIKPPGHKPPDIAAELVRQGANLKKE